MYEKLFQTQDKIQKKCYDELHKVSGLPLKICVV